VLRHLIDHAAHDDHQAPPGAVAAIR
jgi:hypothetical protein